MTQEFDKELTDIKTECLSILDQGLIELVKKLDGTKAEGLGLDLLLINQTAKAMKVDKNAIMLAKIVALCVANPLNLLIINQKLTDMIKGD